MIRQQEVNTISNDILSRTDYHIPISISLNTGEAFTAQLVVLSSGDKGGNAADFIATVAS